MDLNILDWRGALEHEPQKPTYAIRIFGTYVQPPIPELKNSPFYERIATYVFDDLIERPSSILITPEIAQEIIGDFSRYRDRASALVVHCSRGKNRSPAVAMALNDLFSLGHVSLGHGPETLERRFQDYNRKVYRTVMEAGRKGP